MMGMDRGHRRSDALRGGSQFTQLKMVQLLGCIPVLQVPTVVLPSEPRTSWATQTEADRRWSHPDVSENGQKCQ